MSEAPAGHVSSGKLPGTAEYDPRFPNTNQSKFCWTNYVDYYRCARIKGAEDAVCKTFQKNFKSTCPTEWVGKWDEAREAGRFPGQSLINN